MFRIVVALFGVMLTLCGVGYAMTGTEGWYYFTIFGLIISGAATQFKN